MFHPATTVLTEEFLKTTHRGILWVYNKNTRVARLGWITEAIIEKPHIRFQLGKGVTRSRGERSWDSFDHHLSEWIDVETVIALDEHGGYRCADYDVGKSIFAVYPSTSIIAPLGKSLKTLMALGNVMR